MVNVGRLATVRGWVDAFPRPVVAADARLLLVQAWLAGLEGDADSGLRAVAAARRVGYQGENPDGSGTIEESAALLRASFPWSDVGAMLTAARVAYSTEDQRATAWQAVTAMNLGWALILAGRPEEARAPLLQAVRLASRSQQWVSAADSRALLAEVCVASGDLGTAQNWIRDAIGVATRSGVADLPWFGRYQVVDGMIHARTGYHQEADRLISEGLQRMRGAWEPLHVADALLELAAVRQALSRPGEGRAMIEEARAIIDACPDPGMLGERLQHSTRALVPAYRRADQDTGLTKRELDVLRVLAAGATEREAAATCSSRPAPSTRTPNRSTSSSASPPGVRPCPGPGNSASSADNRRHRVVDRAHPHQVDAVLIQPPKDALQLRLVHNLYPQDRPSPGRLDNNTLQRVGETLSELATDHDPIQNGCPT